MSPSHVRLRIFGSARHKNFWETKTEKQLTRRIESKMKEFDTNFVESILEGVKAKVKSLGENDVYDIF